MSELLWPMYHELKARVDNLEAFLNRVQPGWNAPPEPTVPADYNDPTKTDKDADSSQTGAKSNEPTQEYNPPPVDA